MSADGPARRNDLRRYSRFSLPVPAIVVEMARVRALPARDVGAGGIYLYADEAPCVGSRVRVEFVAGKERRFAMSGRVLRHDPGAAPDCRAGFAVTFEEPEAQRKELERALTSG